MEKQDIGLCANASDKHCILIFLGLSALCFLVSGCNLDMPPHGIETQSTDAAAQMHTFTEDSELFLQSVRDEFFNSKPCALIQDSALAYTCKRVSYRPHMKEIILQGNNSFSQAPIEICDEHTNFTRSLCIYSKVFELANQDTTRSNDICHLFADKRNVGECMYYVATAKAHFFEEYEATFNALMAYCASVEDDSWRSECYYVFADELAFQKPEFISGIHSACSESMGTFVATCFNHVSVILNITQSALLCNMINNEQKISCFVGIGHQIAKKNIDPTTAKERCGSLGDYGSDICWNGYETRRAQFRDSSLMNASTIDSYCINTSIQNNGLCYIQAGFGLGQITRNNLSKALVPIGSVQQSKKETFYGFTLSFLKKNDSLEAIHQFLEEIPSNFTTAGAEAIGGYLARKNGFNDLTTEEACQSLGSRYYHDCYSGKDIWKNLYYKTTLDEQYTLHS